jgi:hypothetical protein
VYRVASASTARRRCNHDNSTIAAGRHDRGGAAGNIGVVVNRSPEEFRAFVKAETESYAVVIKNAGITVD